MALSQFVWQYIKKSFEGVHLVAKTYWILPASLQNSTTVTTLVLITSSCLPVSFLWKNHPWLILTLLLNRRRLCDPKRICPSLLAIYFFTTFSKCSHEQKESYQRCPLLVFSSTRKNDFLISSILNQKNLKMQCISLSEQGFLIAFKNSRGFTQ